jgi:hypothetical protein
LLERPPQRGLELTMAALSNVLDSGTVGYVVLSSNTFGERSPSASASARCSGLASD